MARKPCPWCLTDKLALISSPQARLYMVRCVKCGAQGPFAGDQLEAELKWNTRAPEQEKSSVKR